MFDLLKPIHVDSIIEASPIESNEKHPSVIQKLGYDIIKMAEDKDVICRKEQDVPAKKETKDFIKIFKKEWKKQHKEATHVLEERRYNKIVHLPSSSDIQRFT